MNTASHTIACNATQEIENIGFCGRLGQLGETAKKAREAHGFSTQSLSGNGSHVGVASAHEGLETNSMIDVTANLRAIEQPQLNSMRTHNNVINSWSRRRGVRRTMIGSGIRSDIRTSGSCIRSITIFGCWTGCASNHDWIWDPQ